MRVAIVGGGFSGTMMAVELVRLGRTDVVLIERRIAPAAGMAYSTEEGSHFLNVRADNMSAFADSPDHFARWVTTKGVGRPDGFIRRRDYRRYLQDLLAQAERSGRLKVMRGSAVGLATDADGIVIALASGARIGADQAVLAGGNYPGRLPAALGLPEERLVHDPWSPEGAAAVRKMAAEITGDVLLLGTGLTMVDVSLMLADTGFGGCIRALSRRGLVPHGSQTTGTRPLEWQPPARLRELFREIRRRSAESGWRSVVDGLRSHTIALWRGFTEAEKSRFLRHARPWWDVHRHRIAPESAARIQQLKEEGKLEVMAGRIASRRCGSAGDCAPRRRAGRAAG